MTKVKLASTIMLGRDNNGTLEILLVKRNKALAFAGGVWVFPGGKIDDDELERGKDELDAAKLAGVREMKEETDVDVEADQLIFYRHWTTPAAEPRRYATYFFFGATNTSSKVTIDDSEIKDYKWLSPQAALNELSNKKMRMMPPTMMSLQLIKKCTSTTEARKVLEQEKPIHVLPVVQMMDSKIICLYKGDAGYVAEDFAKTGARHRLTIDMVNGTFDFEFNGCDEDILPVNGGMHL